MGPLALAAILYHLDAARLGRQLLAVRVGPLLWALLPLALSVFVKGLRWNLLIRAYGVREPLADSMRTYAVGILYGMLTPGRLGELWKAQPLARRGVSWGRAVTACVLDRMLDLASLAVLALGVLLPRQWSVIAALGMLGAVAVGALLRVWSAAGRRLGPALLRRLGQKQTDEATPSRPWNAPALAFWTLVFWMLYFWQIACLAAAADLCLPAPLWIPAVALAAIAAMLPVSILGLGTREAALLFLLAGRADPETIVLFSLLYLYIYFGGMAIGYAASIQDPRRSNSGQAPKDPAQR